MAVAAHCSTFGDIDDSTSALVIDLQLQDIDQILDESQTGLGREKISTDWATTLRVQQEVLRRDASIVKDRQMSKSIARAVRSDADALVASMAQELEAAADRRMACTIGGVPVSPLPIPPAFATPHSSSNTSTSSSRCSSTAADPTTPSGI